MTNKQTIDGVPRKAIEAILGYKEEGYVAAWKELRALLDKPDECRCKRYGKDNPHWPCPVHAEPAAQHQPEQPRNAGLYPRCTILKECNVKSSPASGARINAVAKPITRRICHGCVGLPRDVFCPICDDEQPAPSHSGDANEMVAKVVLPDRREPTPEEPYLTDRDIERNDVIDEVAKLNGLKP